MKPRTKNITRIIRVCFLAKYYCAYRDIYLNQRLLEYENNYIEAEEFSDNLNSIFGLESKPTDFLHNENDLSNKIIDTHRWFDNEMKNLDGFVLSKNAVMAFVKSIEHGDFHILKSNPNFVYQMESIMAYGFGISDKEHFLEGIKEVSIFTKRSKFNNRLLKKTFLEVEKRYFEILNIQSLRTLNKRNHDPLRRRTSRESCLYVA